MALPPFWAVQRRCGFGLGAQQGCHDARVFWDLDPGIGLRIHARVNTFFLAAGTLLGYDTRVETLLGSLVQVV